MKMTTFEQIVDLAHMDFDRKCCDHCEYVNFSRELSGCHLDEEKLRAFSKMQAEEKKKAVSREKGVVGGA